MVPIAQDEKICIRKSDASKMAGNSSICGINQIEIGKVQMCVNCSTTALLL